MKAILPVLAVLVFASCKKHNNAPAVPALTTFENFIGKYLVMDSIRTTINGVSTLTVVGKGNGSDMVYSSNGTYTIYQTPPVVKNYKFHSPDIIYYWSMGNAMDPFQYTRVLLILGNHIVSTDTETNTTKKVIYYQTAEY